MRQWTVYLVTSVHQVPIVSSLHCAKEFDEYRLFIDLIGVDRGVRRAKQVVRCEGDQLHASGRDPDDLLRGNTVR